MIEITLRIPDSWYHTWVNFYKFGNGELQFITAAQKALGFKGHSSVWYNNKCLFIVAENIGQLEEFKQRNSHNAALIEKVEEVLEELVNESVDMDCSCESCSPVSKKVKALLDKIREMEM